MCERLDKNTHYKTKADVSTYSFNIAIKENSKYCTVKCSIVHYILL